MANQYVRLTLKFKTMGLSRPLAATLKYLAYRLGHTRFKDSYNAFDGDLATPNLRTHFNALINNAVIINYNAVDTVETGAGYIYFDLTFKTDITFQGAQYLLRFMQPFLRRNERTPLASAYVSGFKAFFVHYVDNKKLDYRIVPFTDSITIKSSPEEIIEHLEARLQDAPTRVERYLRMQYEASNAVI